MLALTEEELAPTDTTDAAIEAIVRSPLREIVVVARRGPAQAAFTTPELKEMGELAGADVGRRPGRARARPCERRLRRVRHERAAATWRCCASSPRARPRASRASSACSFCVSPVAILGDDRVEAVEMVRNRLESGRVRPRERGRDGRARDDPGRAGLPQRRLPRRAARRRPVRRAARHDPERGRPGRRRRLLRRLDQARAERRDRHQQEGRDGDRRAAARGLAARDGCRRQSGRIPRRRSSCWPSAASRSSRTRAGRRWTLRSARPASPAASRA